MHVRLKVALAGVVLSTSVATAQQAAPVAAPKSARQALAAAQRSARGVRSLINGVAQTSEKTPVPNAPVQLRNLKANQIEQTTITNHLGEFTFVAQPDVPYIVEIVDQTGRVVAVGDVILASVGDVAGAVVTLPSRLPALAGVFGDTASSLISAATGAGLTVVDPTLPELSPRQ